MIDGKNKIGSISPSTRRFSYRGLDPLKIAAGRHGGPDFPPPLQKGQIFSSYRGFVEFLASKIREKRRKISGRMAVNISGGTNAGKSTLTRELKQTLEAEGIKDIVHFSEDFALPSWEQITKWQSTGDHRFENPWEFWFRWPIIDELFARFRDPGISTIHFEDLFNKSDGQLTLALDLGLTPSTILLYDGVFTFDSRRYPSGFEFSVFLCVRFEETMRRSIAKGRREEKVRETHGKCFIPSQLAYREEFHPEQKADLVVDLNVFDRPQILIYRR